MGVLADHQIRREVRIDPWSEPVSGGGVISYGVSSYGYDLRLGRKFKRVRQVVNLWPGVILDPKNHNPDLWLEWEEDHCVIPPHGFVLAETLEWLEIPRDTIAVCTGKSTYARVGVFPLVTPLEPGWRGKVTLEIANLAPIPVKIYAGEGIVQAVFHRADQPCEISYADKQGKYQNQAGLTNAIVR